MKIVIVFIVSAVISILFPTFISNVVINETVISTLFTIVGIIFSVGMSLIISVSTSGVKNREARKVFRDQLSNIRFHFIAVFIIETLLYILLPQGKNEEVFDVIIIYGAGIKMSCNIFIVACLFAGITYYIINYYSIQSSIYELEDRIDQGN